MQFLIWYSIPNLETAICSNSIEMMYDACTSPCVYVSAKDIFDRDNYGFLRLLKVAAFFSSSGKLKQVK